MTLEQKNKLLSQYAFIHQCLTQKQQYFIDEFEIARDVIQTVTEVANRLADEIKAMKDVEVVTDEPKSE